MIDISTTYMGLQLSSPIIIGSSGLTINIDNLKEFERYGAGAIVLKSLFEEQINLETLQTINKSDNLDYYAEAENYISHYSKNHQISEYLSFIKIAKQTIKIPIIASINCISSNEWIAFAEKMEQAGADALELNIFILPSNIDFDSDKIEKEYFTILEKVKKTTKLPVSLKISYYFSSLAKFITQLSWSGANGLALFNRFYSPDININSLKVIPTHVFSSPEEISISLRWIAMLSNRVNCDLCATTGVHDGEAVIKQLLAGAKAVQITSTLYKNKFNVISEMIETLKIWMREHHYSKISDFNGLLSLKKTDNPAVYERVQFMKHFAGIE